MKKVFLMALATLAFCLLGVGGASATPADRPAPATTTMRWDVRSLDPLTWPQPTATGDECGGWWQEDVYPYTTRADKARTDALDDDGFLTQGEDYNWVISWQFIEQPKCVPVQPEPRLYQESSSELSCPAELTSPTSWLLTTTTKHYSVGTIFDEASWSWVETSPELVDTTSTTEVTTSPGDAEAPDCAKPQPTPSPTPTTSPSPSPSPSPTGAVLASHSTPPASGPQLAETGASPWAGMLTALGLMVSGALGLIGVKRYRLTH